MRESAEGAGEDGRMEAERPARSTPFGNLLRQHRLEAGLSQQALAERARMSERGIGALERGDRRTPQRETLALLADALALEGERRRTFEAAANPAGSRRIGGGSVATGPWPPAPASNLPFAVTSFVGRKREIGDITELVSRHRLVTLTGPGGIGKTRTALEIGAMYQATHEAGVRLIELAPLADPSRVTTSIASALEVQETPNKPLLEVLLTFLERKRLLIVIDNCEHVIDELRHVTAALLRRCPEIRLLATSREALNIAGEHLYPIPPLPAPLAEAKVSARELVTFEAPLLFVERATAANPHFAVTDENASHIAEICRRLDGMPLALELAAARIKMFSPNELRHRLDDRFRLLTSNDRVVPPRQRTIRALIDWSYDLLSAPEQRLFRTLAIFADGFTLEAVSDVWSRLGGSEDQTLDLLSSLLDKSLVQKDLAETQTRYRLLESMQQYARETLDARGEFAPAARAHSAVFLALAERLQEGYFTEPDDAWEHKASPERENWQAVLRRSLAERGDVALGLRLLCALRWISPAFSAEDRKWTAITTNAVDADTSSEVVARLYLTEAGYCSWLTQLKASLAAAERALTFLGPSGDALDIAEAKWRAGIALSLLGSPSEGRALFYEALETFRRLGAPKLVASTLLGIATASFYLEDTATARSTCLESIAIAKAHGFGSVTNSALGNLAELEFRAGDAAAALRLGQEALPEARLMGRVFQRVLMPLNMAAYSLALENFVDARSYAHEALVIGRERRSDHFSTLAYQHLAGVAALRPQRDPELAARDRARAAALIGYVDAALATLGARRDFTDTSEYDRIMAVLSESLEAQELAKLMQEGSAWPEEYAFSEALLI